MRKPILFPCHYPPGFIPTNLKLGSEVAEKTYFLCDRANQVHKMSRSVTFFIFSAEHISAFLFHAISFAFVQYI